MLAKTLFATTEFSLLVGCVPAYDTITVGTKPYRLPDTHSANAKRIVTRSYKDPGSAQFRNMLGYRLNNGDVAICGEVNGRNSYGAHSDVSAHLFRQHPPRYSDVSAHP